MRNSSDAESNLSVHVDKDAIYRTHAIYCSVFDKKVMLREAPQSSTNCRGLIFLNFAQVNLSEIDYEEKEVNDVRYYKLTCGHTHRSAKGTYHHPSKKVPCFQCGSKKAYWSLAHEWGHIIFRSSPFLYSMFAKKYQAKLKEEGYNLGTNELGEFLHMFINVMDDLRVTSLEEHVHPGAAYEIRQKWKTICEENSGLNENFTSFVFGVALEANNLNYQKGPFVELIPVIKEATERVKLKGPANMLTVVRWALDRCIKKLLQNRPPPKQEKPQQKPPEGTDGDQQQNQAQQSPSGDGSQDSRDPGTDSEKGQPGRQPDPIVSGPDSKDGGAGYGSGDNSKPTTPGGALKYLARNAASFTTTEGHHKPSVTERDFSSQATSSAVQQALSAPIDKGSPVDTGADDGKVDQSVQDAVNKLRNIHAPTNASKFILSQAKSNIFLIDVKPTDIIQSSTIDINESDKQAIRRMRTAFARAMGKERAKMDVDGSDLDVSSFIQFLMDSSADEIFEREYIAKGFAWRILGDMSGSMRGDPFQTVCRAHEMLKRALDYPFVQGDYWGFRGAINDREARAHDTTIQLLTDNGEVWLYRYHPDCAGYIGRSKGVHLAKAPKFVDVKCGGFTPMHSALHVAIKDLITQVAVGMVKRLFLLTDGHPTQFTTKGKHLKQKFLRGLVGKEIRLARSKGVQVYTFIIGEQINGKTKHQITDEHALEMFGPPRYWRKVAGGTAIGQALLEVVLSEFVKYLRSK